MSPGDVPYRGRFAPTPSGPLHLGSLVTALAAFLQARSHGGAFLLRIDDLDAPRCPPGAVAEILRQLEAHALAWDEPPRVQSRHVAAYAEAVARLRAGGHLYACTCTRAQLAAQSLPGPDGPVYAGTCRDAARSGSRAALRFRVGTGTLELDDAWQGPLQRDLAGAIGDFTVVRADGQVGYQLACVVDEQAQRITEVVRGADLIGSSLRQRLLQRALAFDAPAYRHLPVLVDAQGRKLSKQNRAAPVDTGRAADNLVECLTHLGQAPPAQLRRASPSEIVSWAVAHWRPDRVPRQRASVVQ